jgi:hypothetical protein
LDPALNKGPTSDEETRLFWERVHEFHDNYSKIVEGRNQLSCYRKFRSTVHSKEFTMLYGDAIKKEKSENDPSWRVSVAKLVTEWLNGDTIIRQTSNSSSERNIN